MKIKMVVVAALIAFAGCILARNAWAAGLERIRPDEIKLKGEIGRRIDLTVSGNLLAMRRCARPLDRAAMSLIYYRKLPVRWQRI